MSKTHGKFVWYDVMTSDPKAAESFYSNVIGWTAKDSGMPAGSSPVGASAALPLVPSAR